MKKFVRNIAEQVANTWMVRASCMVLIKLFSMLGRVWGFFKIRALISVPEHSSCHWSVVIKFPENVKLHGPVMISPGCVLGAKAPIILGAQVRISQGVHLETASLDLNSGLPYKHIGKPITIGNGVWLGAHAIVLGGVSIGDNAVIGAGAIVSKDVPAGSIVVGQGIRVIEKKTDYKL